MAQLRLQHQCQFMDLLVQVTLLLLMNPQDFLLVQGLRQVQVERCRELKKAWSSKSMLKVSWHWCHELEGGMYTNPRSPHRPDWRHQGQDPKHASYPWSDVAQEIPRSLIEFFSAIRSFLLSLFSFHLAKGDWQVRLRTSHSGNRPA